ncbi:33316_t:CDS:1, partial [Racocetra persica]
MSPRSEYRKLLNLSVIHILSNNKKQTVTYTKETGRNKAVTAFKLDPSMVGHWIK